MSIELFLGGPYAGWKPVRLNEQRHGRLLYPIMPRAVVFKLAPEVPEVVNSHIGTYRRRRWISPGWKVSLPIWTDEEQAWDPIPDGTVLPGMIEGFVAETSNLCFRCRARRAPRFGASCNECWFDEEYSR